MRSTLRLNHATQAPHRKLKHGLLKRLVHLTRLQLAQIAAATITCTAAVAHLARKLSEQRGTRLPVQLVQAVQQLGETLLRSFQRPLANLLAVWIPPRRLPRRVAVLDQDVRHSVCLCRHTRNDLLGFRVLAQPLCPLLGLAPCDSLGARRAVLLLRRIGGRRRHGPWDQRTVRTRPSASGGGCHLRPTSRQYDGATCSHMLR